MCDDASAYTTNNLADKVLNQKFTISHGIKHGGMCGKKSAPAHAHSCKHSNRIIVNDSLCSKLGDKAKCCAYGS